MNLRAKLAGTCHGVSAPRLQEHLDEFSRKYRHRRSDQMADLLAELARWPHVRLADIRGARGPLGRHEAAREPGYYHDRGIDKREMRRLRKRLADDLAAVAAAKARP